MWKTSRWLPSESVKTIPSHRFLAVRRGERLAHCAENVEAALPRLLERVARRELAPHAGMLFVFEETQTLCFWMKNTLIPLSIAFLQDDGTILNIEEMKPQTLNSHCSLRPARFALEMNAGWFSKRGLKPGDKVSGEIFK